MLVERVELFLYARDQGGFGLRRQKVQINALPLSRLTFSELLHHGLHVSLFLRISLRVLQANHKLAGVLLHRGGHVDGVWVACLRSLRIKYNIILPLTIEPLDLWHGYFHVAVFLVRLFVFHTHINLQVLRQYSVELLLITRLLCVDGKLDWKLATNKIDLQAENQFGLKHVDQVIAIVSTHITLDCEQLMELVFVVILTGFILIIHVDQLVHLIAQVFYLETSVRQHNLRVTRIHLLYKFSTLAKLFSCCVVQLCEDEAHVRIGILRLC